MLVLIIVLCLGRFVLPATSNVQTPGSKERDVLTGPVRTVSVETARLSSAGKQLSRKRVEVVSYDKTGRPRERDVYNDYGFFAGKESYDYASTGLMSRSTFSDATNRRTELRTYRFDDKGKMISASTYDAEGQLRFRQIYQHHVKTDLVEEITRNPNKEAGKKISKLDKNGATKEVEHYDAQGKLVEKWLFMYGSAGNLTEERLLNPDGSLRKRFTHSYEFDSHGNWIVRRTVVSLHNAGDYQSTFVTYRKINYY